MKPDFFVFTQFARKSEIKCHTNEYYGILLKKFRALMSDQPCYFHTIKNHEYIFVSRRSINLKFLATRSKSTFERLGAHCCDKKVHKLTNKAQKSNRHENIGCMEGFGAEGTEKIVDPLKTR